MKLPEKLQQAIDEEVRKARPGALAKARELLSQSYRSEPLERHMQSDADRLSYIATRMPATYAAVVKVLQEVSRRMPKVQIQSMLDLGAGPGTVLWAATEVLGPLQATLIEQDSGLIALGHRLAAAGRLNAAWVQGSLIDDGLSFQQHDIALFSYSYGELPADKRLKILEKCWEAALSALVVIEPGTPKGYQTMIEARDHLLGLGACMVAPCPHGEACPMQGVDWCHFSARLERSATHQAVKEAYRGFEDEKFSYVALSKSASVLPASRILRQPGHHSGHVNLTLCTAREGILNKTVSRRHGSAYKLARDAAWGDAWEG
jgi:ribosomal protein RSM22 (predicted rRNA methylase)